MWVGIVPGPGVVYLFEVPGPVLLLGVPVFMPAWVPLSFLSSHAFNIWMAYRTELKEKPTPKQAVCPRARAVPRRATPPSVWQSGSPML